MTRQLGGPDSSGPGSLDRLEQEGALRYLVRLPDTDDAVSDRPLLVFLHGYDEGAPTELFAGLTRHGPLRSGNDTPGLRRFIIVAPQLPTRGDVWDAYANAVQEILRRVQRDHRGDARRSYLTGFSFGGNGVFDLAMRQPGAWAALWAVDPTRVPRGVINEPVWLSVGQVARRGTPLFVRALRLSEASDTAQDRVYEDQGADHVGSATLAYNDERVYAWLLTHHRTAP